MMNRLALINANVITMSAERPRAEALLIEGDRIAAVGARAEIQRLLPGSKFAAPPTVEFLWGGWFERLLGERRQGTTPLRAMLDAGLLVAGGSDSYVSPIDPLLGIHAAVNHPNPGQRISS